MSVFLTILITIIICLVMTAGLVGIFLPILPSTPLILVGAFIYGLYFGFDKIGLSVYLILLGLALISFVFDLLFQIWGAKRFKASILGILGTLVGFLIGFFTGNLLIMILGPFLGAILGEIISGKRVKPSFKVGGGSVLGFILGVLAKIVISLIMIGLFILAIIF